MVIKLLEADLSFASALSHLLKANAEQHACRPRKRARVKDVEDVVVDQAVLEGDGRRRTFLPTSSSWVDTTSLRCLLSQYRKAARSLLMHTKPMVRSMHSRCGT